MSRLGEPDACGNCRFFWVPTDISSPEGNGLCRRYPPQVMKTDAGGAFLYPVLSRVAWCGEYEAHPEGYLSIKKGN